MEVGRRDDAAGQHNPLVFVLARNACPVHRHAPVRALDDLDPADTAATASAANTQDGNAIRHEAREQRAVGCCAEALRLPLKTDLETLQRIWKI